jgi:hypothetical protein
MSTTPLLRYTPKFCFWRYFLPKLPICIFAFVWVTGVLGALLLVALSCFPQVNMEMIESLGLIYYVIVGILPLSVLIKCLYIEGPQRFNETEFLFFEEHLTWKSSGLNVVRNNLLDKIFRFLQINISKGEGTVSYKDIKGIETQTSMLQSWYGLGNLYLSLSSQGNQPSKYNPRSLNSQYLGFFSQVDHANVLCLFDLPNAQEAFDQVEKLIHRSNTGSK